MSLRGRVAVAGIGASDYFKHGGSTESEFAMVLRAVLGAADDAGVEVDDIDGFVAYSNDANTPLRLATALGTRELRLGALQYGGGGGGSAGHVAIAAAAIAGGLAECVVAYRGCRQGEVGRFGRGVGYGGAGGGPEISGYELGGAAMGPYGAFAAPHKYALRAQRMLDEHRIGQGTMRAVAMAAYHHAQSNPAAVMRGRTLSAQQYDDSRWIAEPYHLYDCCQESDAAAAILLVSAERARSLRQEPVYVLAAGQSGEYRSGAGAENTPTLATAGYSTLARRLYADAGVTVADVDTFQIYDNFTAGVVMGLVEMGVCGYDDADDVLTVENLVAPGGVAPLNTSGGNFAEAYILGMGHHLEAVRQLRGTSSNQVPGATVTAAMGGPMTSLTSGVLYGTEAVL
ncbi:MAG: acetyl-CoA acetyltransferase [Pseudonocardia sp. SCN 72-86]|nr:MAG: acetyl-CoA acetyltransferase [Pseudonocardia sp. SCN 72-86]